jgi:hypothetical protein
LDPYRETEPLSQRYMETLEAIRRNTAYGIPQVTPPTDEPSIDDQIISFLEEWGNEERREDALTELRRIRVGVFVIAAAMLVCALTGVLLALVISAMPN